MKTILGWVGLILLVIGIGVGIEAAAQPGDPLFVHGGSVETYGPVYVGTPVTFDIPVVGGSGCAPITMTNAWVPDLPPGLTAVIVAVTQGDYALNGDGFPGDPRTHDSSQLVPLQSILLGRGEYEDLLVVLTARHLGTFHIEGYDVSWQCGGHGGVHFQQDGITLMADHTGPDPQLRTSMYGPG